MIITIIEFIIGSIVAFIVIGFIFAEADNILGLMRMESRHRQRMANVKAIYEAQAAIDAQQ